VYERVIALDPRNALAISDLGGNTLRHLHRYEESIAAQNRALELVPDFAAAQWRKAHAYFLWRGELDSLRNVLERGAESYGNIGSRHRERVELALLERKPEAALALLGAPELVTFERQHEYAPGLLYAAWAHQLNADHAAATQAFTGALVHLDSVLLELPDDWRVHASRGLTLAGLGRQSDARQEATRLEEWRMYYPAHIAALRAKIFAQTGFTEEALEEIELFLAGPSFSSAHEVRLDPRYDPIRDDPRFQALLEKYEP
jgi:serine/threonine-protein kinase